MYAIVVGKNDEKLLSLAKEKGLKIVRIEEVSSSNSTDEKKINSGYSNIPEFLCSLGIKTHLNGFKYLRYAIENDIDSSYGKVTKVLYPTIAKAFNTTSVRVERGIRRAIETALDDIEIEKMYENIFGSFFIKPTNQQFIEGCKIYLNADK